MPSLDELRPIGTEFCWIYPPAPNCSATVFTIWHYRIVAHDKVGTLAGPTGWAERLEPIASQTHKARTLVDHRGIYYERIPPDA